MTTTFETAKVGDEVWSMMHGWGFICAIKPEDNFPVKVTFDELEESYLYSGASFNNCSQSLFWYEIVIEAPVKTVVNLTSDAKQESELRDRFAIAYMQSCVAGTAYFETFEGVSEEAYKMADAMLEARSK